MPVDRGGDDQTRVQAARRRGLWGEPSATESESAGARQARRHRNGKRAGILPSTTARQRRTRRNAQQTYNAIGSGGPLWWFPVNDASYSRHHDRWYVSHVEARNNDWGAATSFPTVPGDEVWVSDISGAPPNSACDVNDEVAFMNVGPLHPDDGVEPPRTDRTPDAGYGYAGLQMSMHIGEWWQGMKYRGYWEDSTAWYEHFASRPGFNPNILGWFDVTMRDGSGTVQRPPLFGAGSVDWINPAYGQWQLHGGGSFTMPCLGTSMVQMHGVEDGGGGNV